MIRLISYFLIIVGLSSHALNLDDLDELNLHTVETPIATHLIVQEKMQTDKKSN